MSYRKEIETEDYIISYMSEMTEDECKSIIGKTIKYIEANEYSLNLTLDDGSVLEIAGHSMYGGSLDVYHEQSKK